MDECANCGHPLDEHRHERWRQVLGECHHDDCSCAMYDPRGAFVEVDL